MHKANSIARKLDRLYCGGDGLLDPIKAGEMRSALSSTGRFGSEDLMVQTISEARTRRILADPRLNLPRLNPLEDFILRRSEKVDLEILKHYELLKIQQNGVMVVHQIAKLRSDAVHMELLRQKDLLEITGSSGEKVIAFVAVYASQNVKAQILSNPGIGNLLLGRTLGAAATELNGRFTFDDMVRINNLLYENNYNVSDFIKFLGVYKSQFGDKHDSFTQFMAARRLSG